MSNTRRPKKPAGLRAALAAKKVRVEHYDIPLVDYDTAVAAAAEHKKRAQAAEWAEHDPADQGAAAKAAAKARAELDKCFYRVEFRGLHESEFDSLVTEHPPTEEQAARGEAWNPDTFNYALIAACVIDGDDMTADDWKAELANKERWPRGDSSEFFGKVLAANRREFSEGIPKG